MSTVTHDDLQREIQAKLRQLPPADWVRAMIDHFQRTGSYRPEDLRRLLGDPNRAVELGPNASLASFYSRREGR
ncbi:MAG: hypothetical protein NUV77_12090 [Thermoguttaceae bacterium]|jgi:hypothetical protein|nr:hypothetical protein [Thermoguttaceae bacterium]